MTVELYLAQIAAVQYLIWYCADQKLSTDNVPCIDTESNETYNLKQLNQILWN